MTSSHRKKANALLPKPRFALINICFYTQTACLQIRTNCCDGEVTSESRSRIQGRTVNDLTSGQWNTKAKSFNVKHKDRRVYYLYVMYLMKTWSEALKHVSVSSVGEELKHEEIFLPLWFAAVSLFSCVKKKMVVIHTQQIRARLFFLLLFSGGFLTLDWRV